jgi:preprotein translocase subunit SecG
MAVVLIVLYVLISVLLVFIILIQSNKSAGMGLFGSSESVFGSGGFDTLTKITAGFAIAFVVFAFSISYILSKGRTRLDVEYEKAVKQQQQQQQQSTAPAEGTPAPSAPMPETPAQ